MYARSSWWATGWDVSACTMQDSIPHGRGAGMPAPDMQVAAVLASNAASCCAAAAAGHHRTDAS